MLNWLLALINKRQKQLYEENRELAAANRRVQADNLQLRHDLAKLGVNASRLCTHTVVAVETSHEWRSQAVIELKPATPLAEVITNTELSGLLYPDHQDIQLGQAYIYSRDIDCSHISRFLSLLAVGIEVDDTALAIELNKCVPEIWVAEDAPSQYNLRGATVVFDGVPADLPGANTAFAKVVSVQLTDKCTNFQGSLNLHFNN